MTALILLLIPATILAIFLVPKSKDDIADDGVTVGAGDFFPKDSSIQLGNPEGYGVDKFQDHSTDIYSMSAGTIGLEGSAWHD